jgi:hypothetical protein
MRSFSFQGDHTMPEVLKRRPTISKIHEEFDMSPAKDYHNEVLFKISREMDRLLKDTDYIVKIDTFRYLEDWQINIFGDFKNMMNLEQFVAGLTRFGASKRFIKQKIDEYAGMGMMSPGYAPDIFVTERAERHNEFGVPLFVIEILSQFSRENDLYFKPYFYETIGVREYFISEAFEDHGKLVKGYRLVENRYQPIALDGEQYHSELFGLSLPRVWPT